MQKNAYIALIVMAISIFSATGAAKKVVLVVAPRDFQPTEYAKPKEVLIAAGFQVITVSTTQDQAFGSDGSKVQVDKTLHDLATLDFDGLFIIGGAGAHYYLDKNNKVSTKLHALLKQALEAGKYVGAICYSPRILARAGILQGKKATGWNGDDELQNIFSQYHVIDASHESVVVDGKIITADGPAAAEQFGETIVQQMAYEK